MQNYFYETRPDQYPGCGLSVESGPTWAASRTADQAFLESLGAVVDPRQQVVGNAVQAVVGVDLPVLALVLVDHRDAVFPHVDGLHLGVGEHGASNVPDEALHDVVHAAFRLQQRGGLFGPLSLRRLWAVVGPTEGEAPGEGSASLPAPGVIAA